jgi:hypothetical protein
MANLTARYMVLQRDIWCCSTTWCFAVSTISRHMGFLVTEVISSTVLRTMANLTARYMVLQRDIWCCSTISRHMGFHVTEVISSTALLIVLTVITYYGEQ